MKTYATATIRRATAALAVVGLGMTGLAACGGSDAQTQTNADGKPIVHVSVVHDTANSPKMKDMSWAKKLEAACDCEIQWTDLDPTQWGQQKSAALGAGKIPDVSISAFTTSDMVQFGSSFEDLAPQVDKLSNVKEMFDTYPNAKKMSTDLEGHIYTLPNAGPEGFRGSSSHLMVNKTWLDKLGLKTPTTWDEFEAMLKAFKTEDPNGNGKADEVPFTFPALGTSNFSDNNPFVLLSSSGIVTQTRNQASQYGLYVDNGKVKPWLTSDNFKRLATWLNKLVSEGLLPAQALTQDYSKFTASMQGDVPTAGAVFGWNQIALFGSKYADQYVSIPPLKETSDGPDPVWDYASDDLQFGTGKLSVAADAPNKEAIYKLINALYSNEMSVEQYWGAIPEFTTKKSDTEYEVTQQVYPEASKIQMLSGNFAGWIRPDVKVTGKNGTTTNIEEFTIADDVYKPTYKKIEQTKDYMPAYVIPDSTDQATLANNNTTLMNYAITQFSNWITKGGVDDGWDTYVKKLEAAGLDQNVQIWQKWYDKYAKEG